MSLIKYKSVEQKNDVLNVMTNYKYKYRKYGEDKSSDALDHSISLEPVEDLLSYNRNNEFMERDVMKNSNKLLIYALLDTLSKREKSVLEYYFGIDKDEALSLNEIGEESIYRAWRMVYFIKSISKIIKIMLDSYRYLVLYSYMRNKGKTIK